MSVGPVWERRGMTCMTSAASYWHGEDRLVGATMLQVYCSSEICRKQRHPVPGGPSAGSRTASSSTRTDPVRPASTPPSREDRRQSIGCLEEEELCITLAQPVVSYHGGVVGADLCGDT